MTDYERPHTSPHLLAVIPTPNGPTNLWLSTVNWMNEAQKWKTLARKHEATAARLHRHIRHITHNTSGADRRSTSTTTDTSDRGHAR